MPKQVLAFYYGWYGNPTVSGKWSHWKNVDPERHRTADTKNFPSLGAYDSHDPKVIAEQIDAARAVGITGFIISWWGQGNFEDRGISLALAAARRKGFMISAYYETIQGTDTSDRKKSAVSDLIYLLSHYGSDAAWLKVDRRPVVFVYGRAVEQIPPEAWKAVMAQVRQAIPSGAVFVADSVSRKVLSVFDGSSIYNVTSYTHGRSPQQIKAWARGYYPKLVALSRPGKIATVTVIPGYDDSATPRPPPRPITERWGDETYKILWQEAIRANPDYVLITSWNEWHEGSQIESSVEYGPHFLGLTKAFSEEFLAGAHR